MTQTTTSSAVLKIRDFLKSLPNNVKDIASRAVAECLIGDASHGLKHYPPYKHVPWAKIGGFITDRQRRYVMAAIGRGEITPGVSASNGYLRDAWQYKAQGSRYVITNDVGYADYLVGGRQSRRAVAQGWRTTLQTTTDNASGALRSAVAKINEWLKSHGK